MYKFMVDAESAELWNSKLTLSSRANKVHGMDYTKDVKYLNELGIYTVYDLLTYRPECYAYTPKSWKDIPFKKRMNEYDLKDSFGIKTYNQYIENNAALNSIMKNLLLTLPPIKDFLPASVINNAKLMPLDTAIRQFQYPDNEENLSQSLHRLAFNELFLIQCGLKMIKRKTTLHRQNYHCGRNGELLKKVIASLPFALTGDQERAFETITRDMETPYPMRRLVQCDVGSGKTVVAMLSLVKVVENGFQGVP